MGGGGGGLSRALIVECHLSKELSTPAVASLSTRFRQFPNLFVRMPVQRQDKYMSIVTRAFETKEREIQLATPENTITYHNALCLSPQNFA